MSFNEKTFGGIPHPKTGVLLCTPIPSIKNKDGSTRLAMVDVRWHRAAKGMAMPTNWSYVDLVVDGHEVGEARNIAAKQAQRSDITPEFLFFLDYDVVAPWDAIPKLLYRARCYPDYDIFGGVYTTKNEVAEPLIYKRLGEGPFWDWAIGDLVFDLHAIHMGCTLIRMSLFDRLPHTTEKPWFSTRHGASMVDGLGVVTDRGTEDIYFCDRAVKEVGAKIMADTSLLCGHIDNATGVMYGLRHDCPPARRAAWHPDSLANKSPDKDSPPKKLALDLGAGSNPMLNRPDYLQDRTVWDWETTDIRPGVGVTYVMDTRWLNLPSNRYDFTSSNHHLEHIPRFDQERVWSEIFRVTKPGGTTYHWVPNMEWAAAHIADGHIDQHVMNVLYGGQEFEYGHRDSNIHYYGFTPASLKAAMEEAGFVDVRTESYLDDESLGYHLVGYGTKPASPATLDEAAPKKRRTPKQAQAVEATNGSGHRRSKKTSPRGRAARSPK